MKAVVQRVADAEVTVADETVGKIGRGLFILLGVTDGDTEKEAELLAAKCAALRVFCDDNDKMNLSVKDINGEVLAVSQFTLCADLKKGNRPSFVNAMEPESANRIYMHFVRSLKNLGISRVETGRFGTDMLCNIKNDGPVTIVYDTDIWRKKQ